MAWQVTEDPWTVNPHISRLQPWTTVGWEELGISDRSGAYKSTYEITPLPQLSQLTFPSLERPFDFGLSEQLLTPLSPPPLDLAESRVDADFEDEDVWADVADQPVDPAKRTSRTWEQSHRSHPPDNRKLLSEAGARVWDAALIRHDDPGFYSRKEPVQGINVRIVTQDAGFKALFLLGLGVASPLFSISSGTVECSVKDLRISGLSPESLNGILNRLGDVGKHFHELEAFGNAGCVGSATSSTVIALAGSVGKVVKKVKEHLVQRLESQQSILQLEAMYRRPHHILHELWNVVSSIQALPNEERILAKVFEWAQKFDFTATWMRPLALDLLERISAPWLKAMSQCIWLCEQPAWSSDVLRKLEMNIDACVNENNEDKALGWTMPSFFTKQDMELTLAIREAVALLARTQTPFTPPISGLELRWGFTWPDIRTIQDMARALETGTGKSAAGNHSHGIQGNTSGICPEPTQLNAFDPYGHPKGVMRRLVSASKRRLDTRPKWPPVPSDALECSVDDALAFDGAKNADGRDALPISILPQLSFSSILSAQAELTSRLLLLSLFTEHQLMHHFEIQQAFQLFGSGFFSVQLMQALLSQDLTATESQRKHARAATKSSATAVAGSGRRGLRLGSRTTWPPATSELRLALEGILIDSYRATFLPLVGETNADALPSRQDTPRDCSDLLSFSIRPLSDDDPKAEEAIMDPHSLSALDFLQVSYKPPSILDAIMSPQALQTYDSSFATLLRMARVLWTARHSIMESMKLPGQRDAAPQQGCLRQRLHIEMYRFVEEISAHFKVTIDALFTSFLIKAGEAEVRSRGACQAPPHGDVIPLRNGAGAASRLSLRTLRQEHEETLRRIGSALLLRRRQARARIALDAVLQLVLDSALGDAGLSKSAEMVDPLKAFRTRVETFLDHCVRLRDQELPGGGHSSTGIDNLLERLELAGWDCSRPWWRKFSNSDR